MAKRALFGVFRHFGLNMTYFVLHKNSIESVLLKRPKAFEKGLIIMTVILMIMRAGFCGFGHFGQSVISEGQKGLFLCILYFCGFGHFGQKGHFRAPKCTILLSLL